MPKHKKSRKGFGFKSRREKQGRKKVQSQNYSTSLYMHGNDVRGELPDIVACSCVP